VIAYDSTFINHLLGLMELKTSMGLWSSRGLFRVFTLRLVWWGASYLIIKNYGQR